MALKAALTFEEKIKSAYLHYVLGVEQQAIAVAFEVNHGRVNEACLAIKAAAGGYKDKDGPSAADDGTSSGGVAPRSIRPRKKVTRTE